MFGAFPSAYLVKSCCIPFLASHTSLWAVISLFRSLWWEVERRWVLVSQVHSWQVSQALPFPHKVSSFLPPSTSCRVSLNRAFCGRKITGTAIALKVWRRGKIKLAVFSNHACSETKLFYESCKESLNCHWGEKGNPLALCFRLQFQCFMLLPTYFYYLLFFSLLSCTKKIYWLETGRMNEQIGTLKCSLISWGQMFLACFWTLSRHMGSDRSNGSTSVSASLPQPYPAPSPRGLAG